ncbi:DEAD/DEAH box helicase family protein [Geodermatophilus nigrescens]
MFAAARAVDDRSFDIPIEKAASLSDVLRQPWPAGRWPWIWTDEAARSAKAATEVAYRVAGVLALPPIEPIEAAELTAGLASAGFARELLPAQKLAVATLVRGHGGGNFSVPGSGKTTMAYAAFSLLRQAGQVDRMLVVAPQSAYEAWQEEARDCFSPGRQPVVEVAPRLPRRRSDVVVVNYERAATGAFRAAADDWMAGHQTMVVFDEAHRAKRGAAGMHGQGARDLASLAAARLAMTGTPMPNGRNDLAAVLDLSYPGQGERLASPHTPYADRAWVRITKDQLGLEPAIVTLERVQLDDSHRRLYDAVAAGLAGEAAALQARPDLAERALMRLLACASNPALLNGDEKSDPLSWPRQLPGLDVPLAELLTALGGAARPAKLLAVAQAANEHAAAGEKLLVWTNFIGNTDALARLLAPHQPAVITGRLPLRDPGAPTDRERELRRFREDSDCHVLIATPQTLGEGVSLHRTCQSQVHLDRTFNAGLYLQALDRTHRVGMPRGKRARVTLLVASGTIDEDVHSALTAKLTAMDDVLNDPTLRRLALPTKESDHAALHGQTDIDALLRHLRP